MKTPKSKPIGKTVTINVKSLTNAENTINRLADIMLLYGAFNKGEVKLALTPAITEALNGEAKLLRAQLYATGLFTNIEMKEI